jgi:hypothetical protein
MEKIMNIELRKEILEFALTLENEINRLLISYLNIESENLKTLGHKNTSLSFKSKLDLLSDLNIFTKDEQDKFILLMEFRNQFLHNINCESFQTAIQFLGPDRGKRLLKFDDVDFDGEQEFKYINSYRSLFINCLEIVAAKYEIKERLTETRRLILTEISDYSSYVIDKDSELLASLLKNCLPDLKSDTKELVNFKLSLCVMISDFIVTMNEDEQFKSLKERIKFDDRKVKDFFK